MIEINVNRKLFGANGELNLTLDTTIRQGEFVTIYGPSGAGKTSVLRMLAGLLKPDAGLIKFDGNVWFDSSKGIHRRPQLRNIGLVFQDYSLFPNMTVRGNLEFALQKGQSSAIVDDLLELTELGNLADKNPAILSGGQKQRVALARALVRKPNLLLLDEPLSALDSVMQSKLQDYLLQVHEQFKLTTILVSHDINEVMKMSKRVLILENGRVEKDGAPIGVLPLEGLRLWEKKG
ncbi:MAG TPA: ATP-binding cassette domain-containing protein [Chryseolinea sp.]|nr:ATP-binding cassette domain-containing protein [Chryseolinea sp.]